MEKIYQNGIITGAAGLGAVFAWYLILSDWMPDVPGIILGVLAVFVCSLGLSAFYFISDRIKPEPPPPIDREVFLKQHAKPEPETRVIREKDAEQDEFGPIDKVTVVRSGDKIQF